MKASLQRALVRYAAATWLAASGVCALAEGLHTTFDAILTANVKDGLVDYPAIASNKSFGVYIEQLAQPVSLSSKAQKLAYYINAYNAFSIKGILDGRSPSSLFKRQAFFKLTKYKLAGEELNLDTLEHKMIRPLGEPRIHFALVCAARSCPKLRSEAYTEAKLEAQLEDNARSFMNDSMRNRIDKGEKVAYLSEIFKWFEEDFVRSTGSVQRFVAKYVNDPEVAKSLAQDAYKIKHIDYDWNLNGSPPDKG